MYTEEDLKLNQLWVFTCSIILGFCIGALFTLFMLQDIIDNELIETMETKQEFEQLINKG